MNIDAIKQIVEGHVNEALGNNKDISDLRLEICEVCPLCIEKAWGLTCNSNLWLDPVNNVTSRTPQAGYFKGCGCRLKASTASLTKKCPAGKW